MSTLKVNTIVPESGDTVTVNGVKIPDDIGGGNDEELASIQTDIALLGFKVAANGSLSKYNLSNQTIDDFQDESGIDADESSNATLNENNYYSGMEEGEPEENTGGTVTYDDDYTIHTFTSSGTFQVISGSGTVDYLVAAGGGACGRSNGASGPGGGGGLLTGSFLGTPNSYTISRGGGGAGLSSGFGVGARGDPSSIIGEGVSVTTTGGGGGGGGTSAGNNGGAGGSGGGGCYGGGGGGAGTDGQGRNGGTGGPSGTQPGTGGAGGAGERGVNGGSAGGKGGDGLQSSISGTATYYCGGGGGGNQASSVTASGGNGGGGRGNGSQGASQNGSANTGGGGGGNGASPTSASNGGSGIVILRYLSDEFGLESYEDLVLVSNSTTAQAPPTKGDIVFTYTNGVGETTLNTDVTAEFSADGGSTWTLMTLGSEGTTGGHNIATAHSVPLTSTSGTSMAYRIKTLNQSVSKETRIQAVSLGWKYSSIDNFNLWIGEVSASIGKPVTEVVDKLIQALKGGYK